MKKIVSWIMTLTLICAAIPLLNRSVAEAEEAPGKTYYVSLTGSDSNSGTIDAPFATLEKARDTIRGLSADEKKDGVTVYLRGGNYELLTAGFELTEADSGTAAAPIVYAAYEDEAVALTGQVTLTNDNFQIVTEQNADAGIWDRIPDSAKGKVAVYNLGEEGIPTGEILTSPPVIYLDGTIQKLAEYPSQPQGSANYIRPTRIINNGWSPIDEKDKGDGLGERPPVLGYGGHDEETRIDKWANEDQVFLRGNFAYEWLLSTLQVTVDTTEKTLTGLSNLTSDINMCKFYAFNLLCELDTEGEFYIDRSVDGSSDRADKLYLYVGDGLGDRVVTMAILDKPLLSMKNVSYVSFQGIDFSNTLSTAVKLDTCESCEIKDAEVNGCSKGGIAVSNGHNVVVSGCRIHDITGDGVSLTGGNYTTLESAGHIVEYSDIYNISSGNGVTVQGVGQTVRRNHIYDLPLTAIGWAGNDHLMEFNDIENVCYNTSDAGAIYGGRRWTYRGNVMRYNYFHDMGWEDGHLNGHVIFAIYLDDALSSVEIYGNVVADWWMQGICLGGGRDIKIHDNIYIDTPGWKVSGNDRTFSDWFNTDLVSDPYKEVPITNEYWAAKYPKLAATAGHLVEVWDEENQKMMPDKSMRDADEPDILNPLYPAGNKVYNEISVGTVNDWATLTFSDMPLISELGDFQMPTALYDTPEAQEAYKQNLSSGIRTATMEQMDAWKADYVSTLSSTPTE